MELVESGLVVFKKTNLDSILEQYRFIRYMFHQQSWHYQTDNFCILKQLVLIP